MDDLTGLRLAAIAAAKAQPEQTFENPRVGAVIVKADQVLAVGWHERFGGAHAEMNAFHHLGAARDAQRLLLLRQRSAQDDAGSYQTAGWHDPASS
ncbi:hypothetical protein [uncultured Leuconostoc sp.]|uniref:hypothetical protein n=1 Tax=uncultured Leuconostoc sp. TaxID=173262 RepID=UPI002592C599|nr:hypothetical protein [uncultured Leuconostoc sp.]